MQVDRLLARLILPALLTAPGIASAQEALPTAPTEPVELFRAVCMGGAARLTRGMAEPATYAMLPLAAQRTLGSSAAADGAAAAKAPAPEPAAVPNTIYRIGGGNTYLFVPKAGTATGTLAESCLVLWIGSSEDYLTARKIVLPGEAKVPLYARPESKPDGATFSAASSGSTHYTLATFGGWFALRSLTPPSDPEKAN
jgi:tripartite-type tricarboxylate transporter receptor subunit TctC